MCAADLTPDAIDILRRTASTRPNRLEDVFYQSATGFALAHSQPELLIELCENYYIATDSWSMEALRAPYRGLGVERYGAFHTPLAWLLQVRPLEALALASHILDVACKVQPDLVMWEDGDESSDEPGRVQVELPGRGLTDLLGGSDAWSWYRGGLASPASAVSILLAIERFADELVRTGGTVDQVTEIVLQHTQSVPLVGLCVGLSIRHLDVDAPSDAFLCWVAQRVVWEFEIARTTQQLTGFGLVRTNAVVNEDRRSLPILEVAKQVTASAVLRGDIELIPRLEEAAHALEASSQSNPVVRWWACGLQPSLMRVESNGDRRIVFCDLPEDLLSEVETLHAEIEDANLPDSIAIRYAYRAELDSPTERLTDDAAICRSDRASGAAWRAARVNTAAAVVRATLAGEVDISDDDLLWATDEVLSYMSSLDEGDDRWAMWGSGQAVASALAILHSTLTEQPTRIGLDRVRTKIEESQFQLVRIGGSEILWTMLAEHSSHWLATCTVDQRSDCPNLIIEELSTIILERAVRQVRRPGRRHPLATPIDQPSRYIKPSLLTAPLALAARGIQICQHVDLEKIVESALELHAEAFDIETHPHTEGNHFARIGSALFELACKGNVGRVARYIRNVVPSCQAQSLQGMRQVAGDDPDMRPHLEKIWPDIMSTLAGELTHDDRWTDVHAQLVPNVMVDPYSVSQPTAWNEATTNWIDPRSVETRLAQWVQEASGCGKCSGALGAFMLGADTDWLRNTGLPLTRQLVSTVTTDRLQDHPAAWLADLSKNPHLAAELTGNDHLLVIVDRYVQAEDPYALMARERMDPGSGFT